MKNLNHTPTKPLIKTWAQLKSVLYKNSPNATTLIGDIRETGKTGDPEYLWDILTEVETITEISPFFIKGFHDILRPYELDIQNIYDSFTFITGINTTNYLSK